jgi:hypothetical protein
VLGSGQLLRLEQAQVGRIADLDGLALGLTDEEAAFVLIDVDAAGWGWNVSGGTMDLLTVVLHELGHAAGLEHDDEGLMAPTLFAGVTRSLGPGRAAPSETTAAVAPGRPAAALAGSPAIGLHVSWIHPVWPAALRPQVAPPRWAAIKRSRRS